MPSINDYLQLQSNAIKAEMLRTLINFSINPPKSYHGEEISILLHEGDYGDGLTKVVRTSNSLVGCLAPITHCSVNVLDSKRHHDGSTICITGTTNTTTEQCNQDRYLPAPTAACLSLHYQKPSVHNGVVVDSYSCQQIMSHYLNSLAMQLNEGLQVTFKYEYPEGSEARKLCDSYVADVINHINQRKDELSKNPNQRCQLILRDFSSKPCVTVQGVNKDHCILQLYNINVLMCKVGDAASPPIIKMKAIANYDNPDWGYQRMVMVQPIKSFDDCSDVIDNFIQNYVIALCNKYMVDFTVI